MRLQRWISSFGLSFFYYPLSTLPLFGLWWYCGLFGLSWLYFAGLESSKWQATLGKQILKLRVVDLNGNRVSFWRASARYFGKIISRMTFMVGFLMILFTRKKQALHDKIAATLVISNAQPSETQIS